MDETFENRIGRLLGVSEGGDVGEAVRDVLYSLSIAMECVEEDRISVAHWTMGKKIWMARAMQAYPAWKPTCPTPAEVLR